MLAPIGKNTTVIGALFITTASYLYLGLALVAFSNNQAHITTVCCTKMFYASTMEG
jgi:hypothetical protein